MIRNVPLNKEILGYSIIGNEPSIVQYVISSSKKISSKELNLKLLLQEEKLK